jgi:hypothetical protein
MLKEGECAMLGSQDPCSSLWRVDLEKMKPAVQPACNHMRMPQVIRKS